MPRKPKPTEQPYNIPAGFPRVPLADLQPYAQNPRSNAQAVPAVAKSIQDFGFLVPIVVDGNNVIAAGHTRALAAAELGGTEVPFVCAEHLTEEQIKAFRLADNRTQDYATWDYELLAGELSALKGLGEEVLASSAFPAYEIENYLAADWSPTAKEEGEIDIGDHDGKHHLHLTEDQWQIVSQAIAHVESATDGEVSHGRAVELICADYPAGVNNDEQ